MNALTEQVPAGYPDYRASEKRAALWPGLRYRLSDLVFLGSNTAIQVLIERNVGSHDRHLMAFPASGTLDARMQSVAASPKRILLADDNEVVRSVERMLVETNPGLEICGEAVDGIDVIQKARELKPDLILLDHRMPGLSGVEAASIIKQAWPDIQLSKAMISAAHIDAVLGKPDGLETLLESIQNLLEPAC